MADLVTTTASVVAVTVSLATLITGMVARGRLAKVDEVRIMELNLRDQIKAVNAKWEECERGKDSIGRQLIELRSENIELLRRLVRLENGHHKGR